MSCCSDWQGNVWKRKNVVDLRWKSSTFWLLALSSPLTLYDLNAIPDKCLWGGHLQFLPLAYSVAGLAGPGLIAILYRKSYGPLVISGIGSAMGFILGCFGFHGLRSTISRILQDYNVVSYIGTKKTSNNSNTTTKPNSLVSQTSGLIDRRLIQCDFFG
ncbi:unnamed protein product [Adineta ricciae]|uniref:Uncharacterized protein n=1 Tax=Adineta ricciae TaxID=249248 RepID=A0A815VWP0_ADIRI|nr:unnamed protein product [Adineta ricciae]